MRDSCIPPIVTGEAARQILEDLKRPATKGEIEVLQRAMKNRVKRRDRRERP